RRALTSARGSRACRACSRWPRRAATLACLLALALPARGFAEDRIALDLRLSVLALNALQSDPVLAPLGLGVRVRGGVATLVGPVPSAEVRRLALARLKALPQLAGVRSELFLDPWVDPAEQVTARPPNPTQPTSRSGPNRTLPLPPVSAPPPPGAPGSA